MICPKCKKNSVKKRVNVLIEVSPDVDYVDKEVIRSKDSKVLSTDIGRTTLFCTLCPWFKAPPTFLKTSDKPLRYSKGKLVIEETNDKELLKDAI